MSNETVPALPEPETIVEAPKLVGGMMTPESAAEFRAVAKMLSSSAIVQKHGFKGEGDVFFAMAAAQAVGMSWSQAIQNFYVIEGKICMPGQTMVATIQASKKCMYFRIEFEGDIEEGTRKCIVRSKRRRRDPNPDVEFSLADAKRAGLYPPGPRGNPSWGKYPDDQLCWKAAARACRRDWPDITHGLGVIEDLRDVAMAGAPAEPREIDITPTADTAAPAPKATPLLDKIAPEAVAPSAEEAGANLEAQKDGDAPPLASEGGSHGASEEDASVGASEGPVEADEIIPPSPREEPTDEDLAASEGQEPIPFD